VETLRLDYLSCLLTVVATIPVGRKKWTGLIVSGPQQLDRLRHWGSYGPVRLYPGKLVLHLHLRLQFEVMAG
jgi:hypothetical protein